MNISKVLCCLLSVVVVHATDYYFSSTGNDAADGLTDSTPKQHLYPEIYYKSAGIGGRTPYQPGDKILIKAGDEFYDPVFMYSSGLTNTPIEITSYGTGNDPIIWGDNTTAAWSAVDGYDGLFVTDLSSASRVSLVATTSGTKLTEVEQTSGELIGDFLSRLTPGTWGVHNSVSSVYVKTSDGNAPDAGSLRLFVTGLSISGDAVNVSHLDIRNAYYGMVFTGDYCTVANCSVSDTAGSSARFAATTGGIFASNTVARSGWTMLYLDGEPTPCTLTWVFNNSFSYATNKILNIVNPFRLSEELGGLGLERGASNLVERNTFLGMGSAFVDTFYENSSTIRYNYGRNSLVTIAPMGTGLRVYGNVFNSAGGTGLGGGYAWDEAENPTPDGGTNWVFNNVFYDFTNYGFYSAVGATPKHRVVNNIFVSTTEDRMMSSRTGALTDYNLYFYTGGTPVFYFDSVNYNSLAAYTAVSELDAHSIYSDPVFIVNPPVNASDFRLTTGSPARNAGLSLPFWVEDYSGNLVIGANDIGAYEYFAPSSASTLRVNSIRGR